MPREKAKKPTELEETAQQLGIAPIALCELIYNLLEAKGDPDANMVFCWEAIPPQYESLIDDFRKYSHIPLWWAKYDELRIFDALNLKSIPLIQLAERFVEHANLSSLPADSPFYKFRAERSKDSLTASLIDETFKVSVLFIFHELANTAVGLEILLELLKNRAR